MANPTAVRRCTTALVAATLLLVAACSGSDEATTGAAGPVSSGPVTTATTTTTAPTSPTTTTPGTAPSTTISQPTAFTDTAADAVNELKAAWETGDRARAAAIAPGDVVDALFSVPPGGFEVYGCDTGEFATSNCNYRNRSTGAYIKVTSTRTDQGWQVATITVT